MRDGSLQSMQRQDAQGCQRSCDEKYDERGESAQHDRADVQLSVIR